MEQKDSYNFPTHSSTSFSHNQTVHSELTNTSQSLNAAKPKTRLDSIKYKARKY